MTLEEQFNQAMLDVYTRSGKLVGYWGHYYLRAVRRNGGLATAKRMLKPGQRGKPQKGLLALIDAGRPDLSFEAIVLDPVYQSLFTAEEINEASRRIPSLPSYVQQTTPPEANHPEELRDAQNYSEGAIRRVVINAYERDPRARAACIAKHGCKCSICEMSFSKVYGEIGEGFIHVHHKKPLAGIRAEYSLDPCKDLTPVCPNCHAMLHSKNPPLSVNELIDILKTRGK
jgi:5-methylcytosine-specific restriction protein A